jgi:hypothetical protein
LGPIPQTLEKHIHVFFYLTVFSKLSKEDALRAFLKKSDTAGWTPKPSPPEFINALRPHEL